QAGFLEGSSEKERKLLPATADRVRARIFAATDSDPSCLRVLPVLSPGQHQFLPEDSRPGSDLDQGEAAAAEDLLQRHRRPTLSRRSCQLSGMDQRALYIVNPDFGLLGT